MRALDPDFVRQQFPALTPAGDSGNSRSWALFDNAGGSVAPRQLITRVNAYLSTLMVQLGASYRLSEEATSLVHAGQRAAAELVGASPEEVVIGPSTTMNVHVLASALGANLAPGDEIVVTNLDHESNIGAWRRLEPRGVVIREWCARRDDAELQLEDLEPLLGPRTKLVCFSHCSNVAGTIHDARRIVERVHEAGALACVDGVAFAPHRRVDVPALGADVYLVSLYKVFGPHLGLAIVRQGALARFASQNHFFLDADTTYQLTPGNVNHELTAALPGILDYFDALHAHHFPGSSAARPERLAHCFELIAEHERALLEPLLAFLRERRGVRVIGRTTSDVATRAPVVSFVVEGRKSSELPPLLDARGVAIRWGHFYAYRAIRDLGLLDSDGVVRVSMAHYNTRAEVDRLIDALDRAL